MLNGWTFAFACAEFVAEGTAAEAKPLLMPAIAVCPLFSALVVGLLLTHSAFALVNGTSFETFSSAQLAYLRGRARGGRSPFDRGVGFNLATFCCGCARPAPVDWQALLDAADDGAADGAARGAGGPAQPLRAQQPPYHRSIADALGLDGALSVREAGREPRGAGLTACGLGRLCKPNSHMMELV